MTEEMKRNLSAYLTALLNGVAGTAVESEDVYAYRLLRWEADVPLTEEQRAFLLARLPEDTRLCGAAGAAFSADGDDMTILLAMTEFPARVHRDTALWLCARAMLETCNLQLEQEGTLFVGEEFTDPARWRDQADSLTELSQWWEDVAPVSGAEAHRHRNQLQMIIKRRQFTSLGGYVSRALRGTGELSRVCFGFVPLMLEAVWSQHGELALRDLTGGLSLSDMTRRPREALLSWVTSLQEVLKASPAAGGTEPIDRVIAGIRADCSLPYSQTNLSRSLGLTPSYFCRLFHEKTGRHFSAYLTQIRMEKAQELLAAPEGRSLQEISQACGYPNRSYFCQVFKKYTGLTPGEFEALRQEA